ncbi:glycosyltransferase [Paeniglutamicibacter terrestris]|uniref:Glycosyl transferase n=1 Tax=Paeniglutamicibacter terrestris TaxID=2723403 RepID=A0ABX1G7B8_9MICC|nr:glycosyl transferase [Arthrobacter sp. 7749]NKG21461.1 glycosyl transferase [Paeniglutamicibacter terrestris]
MKLENGDQNIVVSLGTDHHRFDRAVDWIDDWLETQETQPRCLIQHGSSRQPRQGNGVDRMPRTDLLDLYAGADAVIVQGGPGSILDVREMGKIPIAIPRRPELDEVVDGHQIAFARFMASQGEALLAESADDMDRLLKLILADPNHFSTPPRHADAGHAAGLLAAALDTLESHQRHDAMISRLRQMWGHH